MTETIRLEMEQLRALGRKEIGLVFGSQGEAALKKLRPDLPCVQMSNFVGVSLDFAAELGFHRVLIAGQPGKLVKVSGGSMQTHSRYGDGRKEPVCAHLALLGAPMELLRAVMDSPTLDGVITPIGQAGYSAVWNSLCAAASRYCKARARNRLRVDTLLLDAGGQPIGGYKDE